MPNNTNKPTIQIKKAPGPQLQKPKSKATTTTTAPAATAPQGQGQSQDTAEVQSLAEMSQVLEGFKARAEREDQRFLDATDSEYWFAVCFQTRAQKEEFIQKLGVPAHEGDKYIDGLALAKLMGISIESPTPAVPRLKVNKRFLPIARPLPSPATATKGSHSTELELDGQEEGEE